MLRGVRNWLIKSRRDLLPTLPLPQLVAQNKADLHQARTNLAFLEPAEGGEQIVEDERKVSLVAARM